MLVKTLVKWHWSVNPQDSATSASDAFVPSIASLARSTRKPKGQCFAPFDFEARRQARLKGCYSPFGSLSPAKGGTSTRVPINRNSA